MIITHWSFFSCQVDDPNLDNVMADYQKHIANWQIKKSPPASGASIIHKLSLWNHHHHLLQQASTTSTTSTTTRPRLACFDRSIQDVQKVCLVMLHKNRKFLFIHSVEDVQEEGWWNKVLSNDWKWMHFLEMILKLLHDHKYHVFQSISVYCTRTTGLRLNSR